MQLHRNTSVSLHSNDLTLIEKWGKGNLVLFDQSKTKKAVISRKHNQNFPPVLMLGDVLDTSASFTQLGLSLSSNLSWKTHIHSPCSTCISKARFPRQSPRVFLIFSPSNYIQVPYPSFSRVLLPHLGLCSRVYSLSPRQVQSKAIHLIKNLNLPKSLQPLSRCLLVGDLSIFYMYFHRHCSQEIREIIPVPLRRVRTTGISTQSHPFQASLPNPRTLSHKSSFIPRTCNLWNVLPSSCFPESYNLPSFKSKINKLDLISLCIGHHSLSSKKQKDSSCEQFREPA